MTDEIYIEDESGDKKYFTMLPNYILNHSTAIDQALYCQLKKFAGENGVAYPSATTLIKKLGVTSNTIKKSIAYLIKRGWIKENGKREITTSGGKQFVNAYKVLDIWKLNIDHYEKDCQNSIDPDKDLDKEPSNREVANATSPKQQAISFFLMVKENNGRYAKYLASLNAPESIARREIDKFTAYWTELNATGTKQRWEKEPTFEVLKRLRTWINGSKEFKGQITSKYKATSI